MHLPRACLAVSCLLALTLVTPPAQAQTRISELDLSRFSFDVLRYNTGTNEFLNSTASGTSGGVGWAINTPTSLWSGRTTTTGGFRFSALPLRTDNLHPGSNYTIEFERPVQTLLVALSNDNCCDSINFGIMPTDWTSGVSVAPNGQVTLNSQSGGLVLFTNLNTTLLHNTNSNGINDGYDLAFWAVTAVPEPATVLQLLAGLGALGYARRRSDRSRGTLRH